MARKVKSERKPPRAGADGTNKTGTTNSSGSRLSRLLPLVAAVVVVLVAVGANVFPQLWKSGSSDLYISRHEVLERKRFDVACHLKKVRSMIPCVVVCVLALPAY